MCQKHAAVKLKEGMIPVKRILVFFFAALFCFSLAACSGKESEKKVTVDPEAITKSSEAEESKSDETESEAEDLMSVETEYGNLLFPAEWKETLITEETNEEDFLTVIFSTKAVEQPYTLFRIMINDEEGDSVGRITDKTGITRNVFVEVSELPDLSGLGEEDQNRLYAMQESLNVLIENLE